MKQFIFLIIFMASVFANANSNVKITDFNSEIKSEVINEDSNGYIVYTQHKVKKGEITLPFIIQVPIPPTGSVIGISGPGLSYITNWNVSGGYLTITYTKEIEIMDIRHVGTFYIEVPTSPMPSTNPNKGYVIELIVE